MIESGVCQIVFPAWRSHLSFMLFSAFVLVWSGVGGRGCKTSECFVNFVNRLVAWLDGWVKSEKKNCTKEENLSKIELHTKSIISKPA